MHAAARGLPGEPAPARIRRPLPPPNPRQSAEGPPRLFPASAAPRPCLNSGFQGAVKRTKPLRAGCIVLPRLDKFGELNRRAAVSRLAEKRSRDGNGTGTIPWKNVGADFSPPPWRQGPCGRVQGKKPRAARRRLDRPEEERRPGPWSLACPAGGSSASSATRPSRVPHARAGWPARGGGEALHLRRGPLQGRGEGGAGTRSGRGRRGAGGGERGAPAARGTESTSSLTPGRKTKNNRT